jgi:glycosyl transferase family 8
VIHVFVGASEAQAVPALVLRHSIVEYATQPVDVTMLWQVPIAIPKPKDPKNRPRTPFSFQRFAIPQLCDYRGRAIYLDSDMLVLDDIAKLWRMDMEQASVLATDVEHSARNAVLLIDCERARWTLHDIIQCLDEGRVKYMDIMENLEGLGPVRRSIPARWNRLDENPPGTALIHFTDMRRQPWLKPGHPLESVWLEYMRMARSLDTPACDFDAILARAEALGHVRPGLAALATIPP